MNSVHRYGPSASSQEMNVHQMELGKRSHWETCAPSVSDGLGGQLLL